MGIAMAGNQPEKWEVVMPARFRNWSGIEHSDYLDIQAMRQAVAGQFAAFAAGLQEAQQQQPKT